MSSASNHLGRVSRRPDTPLHIAPYSEQRDLLLPLYELADDFPAQISTYISRGELMVVREQHHLQILETGDAGVFEIKSMAVMEDRQGEGIGRSLVEAAVVHCRARNGHRLIVSTATADIGNLRFSISGRTSECAK